jgi:hypothetical protein
MIGVEFEESSNWHTEKGEGLEGLDGLLEGEVDMEEEDIVELEPEEEAPPPPAAVQRWNLMCRYTS